MSECPIDPHDIIKHEASLRAMFHAQHPLAIQKYNNKLVRHARDFIERAPFVCIGTQNLNDKADVSPRGDPVGFVKILDNNTLAIRDTHSSCES